MTGDDEKISPFGCSPSWNGADLQDLKVNESPLRILAEGGQTYRVVLPELPDAMLEATLRWPSCSLIEEKLGQVSTRSNKQTAAVA